MKNSPHKILLVDDNESIHKDIESILLSSKGQNDQVLREMEDELFGEREFERSEDISGQISYEIDHAYQGQEAIEMVEKAEQVEKPYSLIFMDVRMPPGIDGIQTIKQIWDRHPLIEVVICTAYSDYSLDQITKNLGSTDKLLFMKKPFDATALRQTALTLTNKWELQQEALKYTEKLEQEVTERTSQLHDLVKEYKKMKEKAERASQAKSEFLANVSHEIRTPMNGVIGMNSMLMETDLDEEQRELSEMVKHSGESLLNIINDILDFSKIEAGKLDLEKLSFDVHEMLKSITGILAITAKEKDLEIDYSIDNNVPERVVGDPNRIRQILLNFGSNAVKFTSEGKIQFHVSRVKQNDNQRLYLKFAVQDTGIGISKKKQDFLFKPFTQADASTTRKYGGTGLGLAISKRLAKLMNGEIGVESEPGKGSNFWVTANLQKAENEGENTIKQTASNRIDKSNVKQMNITDLKILVAEDNAVNQIVAQKMLGRMGFQADVVGNGSEAVKAVEKNNYHAVLMDVQMPEMDGYEATSAIRSMEKKTGEHIPIIALTASAMQGDKDLCIESGMDDYLSKPIIKADLEQKVLKWAKSFRKSSSAISA